MARKSEIPLWTQARAVVESAHRKDGDVAKELGVTSAQIRTWRAKASTDPELRDLVAHVRRTMIEAWVLRAQATKIRLFDAIDRKLANDEEIPLSYIALAGKLMSGTTEAIALGTAGVDGVEGASR